MAFVPALPVLPSARTSGGTSLRGHSVRRTGGTSSVRMAVEFQTYSGGLDRKSLDPYSITRYLFKPPPKTLSAEDKDQVINVCLRQVFGNAYLMEEERAEIYPAESKFRCGEITAKDFVRAIAKSATYKSRFFDSVTQFRFIELNFKHLLGRAPLNQVEYSKHFKIFAQGGYDAEIDSYLDDGEYDDVFGEDVFPFTRFRGTYAPINQFNRMCTLEGGFAGSDKKKPQMLVTSLAANVPTSAYTVADGLPPIPNAEHPSKKYEIPSVSLERYKNELQIAKAKALEVEVELRNAYEDLEKARGTVEPFKNMLADMDISPRYGVNFGNGAVKVFAGQFEGTPQGQWGASGVDTLNGPTRRPAVTVGKKEKQLEGLKQIVLDLERLVAVKEAELDAPALTPPAMEYQLAGVPVIEEKQVPVPAEAAPAPAPEAFPVKDLTVDPADEDSGVVVPKKVVVSTSRMIDDEVLGKNPGELIKEMGVEKKAEGEDVMGGKRGLPSFPGDGSEMVIGS